MNDVKKAARQINVSQKGNRPGTKSGREQSGSVSESLRMMAMQESIGEGRNPQGVHYSDGFRDESPAEQEIREDSLRELLRHQPGLCADGFDETAVTDQTGESNAKRQLKYIFRISQTILFPQSRKQK